MMVSVCSNIFIDGATSQAPARYEQFVNKQVEVIFSRRTGYWVLWEIDRQGTSRGKVIHIAPFTADEQKAIQEGAETPFPETHYRQPESATARTRLLRLARVKKRGEGSDIVIHYDPDQLASLAVEARSRRVPMISCEPDEALFHELLHGLRGMCGMVSNASTEKKRRPEISAYNNVEDFFAILVTNIYMSEKGKGPGQLRRNHRGFGPLPESLNSSEKFLGDSDNVRWIRELWMQEAELFGKLARVRADFNPIREYEANRARYDR